MYETLSVMKLNRLLMAVSMLYHTWEQQLIKFTINELLQNNIELTPKILSYKALKS